MREEVADGGDGFRISARQVNPDILLVAIAGDLDVLTVAQTATFLTQTAAASTPRHLILDLSEVTFLTSSGIGLLIAASENGTYGRLHLLGVLENRSVQRPLASVGLLGLFDIAPDLDTLLARLRTIEPSSD
jgi:anti-sigma B factor antagonist